MVYQGLLELIYILNLASLYVQVWVLRRLFEGVGSRVRARKVANEMYMLTCMYIHAYLYALDLTYGLRNLQAVAIEPACSNVLSRPY